MWNIGPVQNSPPNKASPKWRIFVGEIWRGRKSDIRAVSPKQKIHQIQRKKVPPVNKTNNDLVAPKPAPHHHQYLYILPVILASFLTDHQEMQCLCGEFGATLGDLRGFEKGGKKSIDPPLHEESLEFASTPLSLPPSSPLPLKITKQRLKQFRLPEGCFRQIGRQ